MGQAFSSISLAALAVWAWCIVLFGWPGWPFEIMPSPVAQTPPAAPAPTLPDLDIILRHYEKIFSAWAAHANLTLLCGVGVVGIVAWMAVKLTKQHTENPRIVYYVVRPEDIPSLGAPPPRAIAPPNEERRNLPAVRRDDARTI